MQDKKTIAQTEPQEGSIKPRGPPPPPRVRALPLPLSPVASLSLVTVLSAGIARCMLLLPPSPLLRSMPPAQLAPTTTRASPVLRSLFLCRPPTTLAAAARPAVAVIPLQCSVALAFLLRSLRLSVRLPDPPLVQLRQAGGEAAGGSRWQVEVASG